MALGIRERMAARRERRAVAHDGADTTGRGRPSAGHRAARGASGVLNLLAAAVDIIVAIVAIIIVAAILFVVLSANKHNSIVSHVLDWAKTLVGPFDNLFTPKDHKVEITVNYGIALAVYLIVGRFIASMLRRAGPRA